MSRQTSRPSARTSLGSQKNVRVARVTVPVLAPRKKGRPAMNLPDAADVLRELVAAVKATNPDITHDEMVDALNRRSKKLYTRATFRAWLAPDRSDLHRRFPPEMVPRVARKFAESFGIRIKEQVVERA